MSQSLVRPNLSAAVQQRGVPRRVAKAVNNAIAEVAGEAIVHATRVEAAAWLANSALTFVADLTQRETEAANQYPEHAARFKAIVDVYTGLAVNELREMGS
jgi:hypothetical protein